jgi:hypothetical protein
MRRAVRSNNSKLFTTKQYLTKNQIRDIFGRFTKKGSSERQTRVMKNNGKNDTPTSSGEDDANEYCMMQQIQQIDDLKADEVENVINWSSDDEYDTN